MTISHLSMFYNTRFSPYVENASPANNPNTELSEVPLAAEIHFEEHPSRYIDATKFEAPNGKGRETALFLIGRSLLDPDATVVPA